VRPRRHVALSKQLDVSRVDGQNTHIRHEGLGETTRFNDVKF